MNTLRLSGIGLGIVICTMMLALTQSQSMGQQKINKPFDRVPLILTPTGKANIARMSQLNDAAEAAQNRGDYVQAEADAQQAVSLTIGNDKGQKTLAAALDAQGKTQQAVQAYKVLADEGNDDPSDELPYARLLLQAGQWKQAVAAYNKQLPWLSNGDLIQAHSGFSPDVPRPMDMATAIHIGLGLELGWQGYHGTYKERVQQAQEQFRQAAALEPKSSLANYYVGYGLNRMGRRAEAQKAFQKAAALGNGGIKAAALKELPVSMQPR